MSQVLARRAAGGVFPATLPWSPLNLAVVPPVYLDMADSLITEVSGKASVVGNLGSRASAGDFTQGTSTLRPAVVLAELNGKRVLRFDGTGDYLSGAAGLVDIFQNAPAAWAFAVYKKRTTDVADTWRIMFSARTGVTGTRFSVNAGNGQVGGKNKPTLQARRLDAESLATLANAAESAGAYAMALHEINYLTREGRIHLAGSVSASNSLLTASAGNSSDTPSTEVPVLGATSAGTFAADIDLAAVVIGNAVLSASDSEKLFGWAAHKWGLTAQLPPGHPYKSAPPSA